MQCPICSIDLVMSERQGIEIDYCPKCRGVWLDRGELDKIIEKTAPSPPSMNPQEMHYTPYEHRDHDDHHKYHGGYRRKKSFLEELFD